MRAVNGMPYLYILYSDKIKQFYIGSTTDMERRIYEHNIGNTASTIRGIPWRVVFKECTETLEEARLLERRVKSWKSRKLIEEVVRDQILKTR